MLTGTGEGDNHGNIQIKNLFFCRGMKTISSMSVEVENEIYYHLKHHNNRLLKEYWVKWLGLELLNYNRRNKALKKS